MEGDRGPDVTRDGHMAFRPSDDGAGGQGRRMGNPFAQSVPTRAATVGGRPAVLELAVERVLDKRYKIVTPIGAGGSSQVYLAQDTVLNREVAIKVLDAAAAADANLRRMFVKEARSLASLSHPSIVAVYETVTWSGLKVREDSRGQAFGRFTRLKDDA